MKRIHVLLDIRLPFNHNSLILLNIFPFGKIINVGKIIKIINVRIPSESPKGLVGRLYL